MLSTRQILGETRHRPWPLPAGPWIMRQDWHDVLFAHWPVPPSALRDRVPARLELETFDGAAWLGIVPFRITGLRPRGVPALPRVSRFPELNVRTYVRHDDKPGVFFFSLDAGSRLAVLAARTLFFLPYFPAAMRVTAEGDAVRYRSRRRRGPAAELAANYGPTGPVAPPPDGSLDAWLTERYCLFTPGPRGRLLRVDIHHPPWPLQPAFAHLDRNTMAAPLGLPLPGEPARLHFAASQHVLVWPPADHA